MTARGIAAIAVAALLLPAGCGNSGGGIGGHVTVFAASSLTDAFSAVAELVEREHPRLDVRSNSAGTATLVAQIRDGARADVVAAAEEEALQSLHSEGLLRREPAVFTTNRLTIVVAPGNPAAVRALADLGRPGLVVALAAPGVPAGRLAREAFARAGVTPPDASLEPSVRGVLSKVALGEADAGVVFVTDARAGEGRVDRVEIPEPVNPVARYSIGIPRDAPNVAAARVFVDAATSSSGQRVLARFGFLPVL